MKYCSTNSQSIIQTEHNIFVSQKLLLVVYGNKWLNERCNHVYHGTWGELDTLGCDVLLQTAWRMTRSQVQSVHLHMQMDHCIVCCWSGDVNWNHQKSSWIHVDTIQTFEIIHPTLYNCRMIFPNGKCVEQWNTSWRIHHSHPHLVQFIIFLMMMLTQQITYFGPIHTIDNLSCNLIKATGHWRIKTCRLAIVETVCGCSIEGVMFTSGWEDMDRLNSPKVSIVFVWQCCFSCGIIQSM
jgi:hypothetical protein